MPSDSDSRIVQLPIKPQGKVSSELGNSSFELQSASSESKAGTLGMAIFLASLTVLFLASMVGYLVVRLRAETWPPAGMPRLPSSLWLSTCAIVTSSFTIQSALKNVRRNHQTALCRALLLTTILGFLFLVVQTINWYGLLAIEMTMGVNLYAFTFYMLTGLHAVHVIGGLIPLVVVTTKAFRGYYTPTHHNGVLHCTMYWHFLDAVWLTMFILLLVFS